MRSTVAIPAVDHLGRRSTLGLLATAVAACAVGFAAGTSSSPWAADGDRPAGRPAAIEQPVASPGAALASPGRGAIVLGAEELAVGYAGQVAAAARGAEGALPAPEAVAWLGEEELAFGYDGQVAAATRPSDAGAVGGR